MKKLLLFFTVLVFFVNTNAQNVRSGNETETAKSFQKNEKTTLMQQRLDVARFEDDFNTSNNSAANKTPAFARAAECNPITSFPWTEGFESAAFPPECWDTVHISGNEEWTRVNSPSSAHSGNGFAYNWYDDGNSENWLITPQFSIPATGVYVLEFYSNHIDGSFNEYNGILISTSDNSIGSFTQMKKLSGSELSNEWQRISIRLDAYAGQNIYIAFKYAGLYADIWMLDDITIKALPAKDAAITAITAPIIDGIDMTTTETVTATILNEGSTPITTLYLKLTVDGNVVATETFTGNIAFDAKATYTFSAKANLSAAGDHTIMVTVILVNDEKPDNDNFSIIVNNTICAGLSVNLPLVQNFQDNSYLCWTRISNNAVNGPGGSGTYNMGIFIVQQTNRVFGFSSYTTADDYNQYLITPELPTSDKSLKISFDYAKTNIASELFSVGYSTTTNDVAAFTWDAQVIATNNSPDFKEYSLTVPSGTKFIAINYQSNNKYRLFVDNIVIKEIFDNDVAVTAITAPEVNGINLTTTETVTATIKNEGTAPITTLDLKLTVDGNVIATETFTGNIAANATESYTFTAKANLMAAGNHTIIVTAILANDGNTDNNSFSITVNNSECGGVASFPWTEDFEDTTFPPACWTTIHIGSSQTQTWDRTTTNTYDGSSGSAYHRDFNWKSTGSQTSYLITPAIIIPEGQLATLEFMSRINPFCEGSSCYYDYSGVHISTTVNDNIDAFTEIHPILYGDFPTTPTWQQISVDLKKYAGQTVYIAFVFRATYNHDWRIDNVTIPATMPIPVNDAIVTAITSPVSGINLTETETVTATIKNNGLDTITTLDLELKVDGNVVATETFTTSIAPDSTANYTFAATADLSADGDHTIMVTAILADDEIATNDSKTITVKNVVCNTVTSFPWIDEFAVAPDCWTVLGGDEYGNNWFYAALDGNGLLASYSSYQIPFHPDNWLVSPQLALGNNDYTLSFKVRALSSSYFAEKYSVLISKTGMDIENDFTEIHTETLTGSVFKTVTLPLSSYANESVYVAFRHWDCTDMSALILDDVSVDIKTVIPVVTGNEINIYQNNGNVFIEFSENSSVRLLDVSGRVLGNYNVAANSTLSINQPSGIYLLEVRSNGNVSTHKLVVK